MLRIPSFFVHRCEIGFDFLCSALRRCAPAQISAAIHRSQSGRLLFAMAVSVLLHLSPFIANLFQFAAQGAGRQIVLQVSLQAAPGKPVAKSNQDSRKTPVKKHAPGKPDKKSRERSPEKILTGNSAMKIAPEKKEAQQAAENEPSEQASHEARLIEDPGAPAYPAEAVQRNLESCVLAAVYVSATGEVEKAVILHADVPGMFDRSVIEAQAAARYLPARAASGAVASRVLAVVSFVLEPGRYRNCALQYAAAAREINRLPVAAEIPSSMLGGVSRGQ